MILCFRTRQSSQQGNLKSKTEWTFCKKRKNTQRITSRSRSMHHDIDDDGSFSSSLYSPKSCPIRIEKYKDLDDICWSRNDKCYHAHHLIYMIQWLMKHDNLNCPMFECAVKCFFKKEKISPDWQNKLSRNVLICILNLKVTAS